ncbi:MAG: 50S ribosomal protein L18 [Planctomycetota bacterium]
MQHNRAIFRQRKRRRFRVRKAIKGTPERPRLSVARSHKNIAVQVIDDLSGKTLASASTLDKGLAGDIKYGGNVAAATAIGKAIADRCQAAGIKSVCFDRGSCKYHGRVAALAEAAREAGLEF